MTFIRVFRYLVALIITLLLMSLILPHFGVSSTHYMPPSSVYKHAVKTTRAISVGKIYSEESANYLSFGSRNYFFDYTFQAIDPATLTKSQPTYKTYTSTMRVPAKDYDLKSVPVFVVRYEKMDPEINGLDQPSLGMGCKGRLEFLSGWMLYPILAIVIAWLIMMPLEKFGKREDI